jgi:hypothetical protein
LIMFSLPRFRGKKGLRFAPLNVIFVSHQL